MNRHERFGIAFAQALRAITPGFFWLLAILIIASAPRMPLLMGLMAAGTMELKSDGSLQMTGDGSVRLANGTSDNCNCVPPCSHCSGGCTPSGFTVTITGTVGDATCYSCVPFSSSRQGNGANFDGTYDLTQNASSPCLWQYNLASGGSISWNQYFGSTCSGSPSASGSGRSVFITALTDTSYSLESGPDGGGTGFRDYLDTLTKPNGICGDFTSTNEITATGCTAGTINFAHGGSATATAIFS